ncbi:hypothetical protein HRR83_006867 [Exophiala dermatitidis]|uniref:Zn(2)-C6 fungal-type domain-containing protein n=1 Tax=Exophiala dermatitidis TaxID=5970 RepID=A0AAN6ES44_EXODE|nr:hypothetical protein HRR73_005906 [Exophiala dermatitidis]KAJ4512771.1 hypothetical protein HRR74_006469 [Exophiala dermatitidis]KAJ4570198.1 hypothetical protein HRR82_007409 [Exophiala dermatitidis]KAJ4579840.1 hypothetical protein HRR81_002003 [Exophiala dermatitidis]KAJ4592309.1 hypothetical protein HRR83_006867 [Exophiala dermatitidis]
MPGTDVAQISQRQSPQSPNNNDEQRQESSQSRRRQPKSRAGCNTCKAKRMKCDEARPSCSRCIERGVECGGYDRNLKWKLVGGQPKQRKRPARGQSQGSETMSIEATSHPFNENAIPDAQNTTSPQQSDASLTRGIDTANNAPLPRVQSEHDWSLLLQDQLCNFTDGELSADFFIGDENMQFDMQINLGSHGGTALGQLAEDISNHGFSLTNPAQFDSQKQKSPDLSDLTFSPISTLQDFEGLVNAGNNRPQTPERSQAANASARGQSSWRANQPGNHNVAHQQPSSFIDTPETVKQIFDEHLSDVISIKDDQPKNPWRVYVWPMADSCPALYHALAAMTYLYASNSRPQLRTAGLEHLRASRQAFTPGENTTNMSLHASLAARLVLSFAESWGGQPASCAIEHIRIAAGLLRDAFEKHQNTRLKGEELGCLSFLARIWIYKDVINRLTTSYKEEPVDVDSITAYVLLDPVPLEQQLHPLLGCAIKLFPLLGRLTDVIKSVQRRSEKHNSPSMISRAAALRLAIESWSPSIDSDQSGGLTSYISDFIQTAEAYRWAALLLLRQAVPELPWIHSFWELAEKVSIYLATTPVTSQTTIIQTFPLMVIGGEAFDQEDRKWVCERWDAMSTQDPYEAPKCKRVTQEVWRRRDEFEAKCGVCPSCGAYRVSLLGFSPSVDNPTTTDGPSVTPANSSDQGSRRCRCSAATRITAQASRFPDSLAFKKGIDNFTRAGNLHYTVRGDLHWLGVLKDWDWEVLLG